MTKLYVLTAKESKTIEKITCQSEEIVISDRFVNLI